MVSLICVAIGLLAISSLQILFFKIKFVVTLPTTIAALMLVLHGLAFANVLFLIDWIMLGCALASLVAMGISKRSDKADILREGFLNPSSLVFILVCIMVIFGMSGTSIIALDDYKFWGATVKSLYYQNGYGAPYTNVDINYGEYPQGTLLLLWLGEHCCNNFREDVLYISYVLVSLCFILPLFRDVEKYRYTPFIAILVIAFSSAFTRFGASLEPDRMMALAYGAAIVSAYDAAHSEKKYFIVQFTLVCCAIVLMKSAAGVAWSLFAVAFLFVVLKRKRRPHYVRTTLFVFALIAMTYLTWSIYCGVFEREAYLLQEMRSSLELSPSTMLSHIKEYSYLIYMFLKSILFLPLNCANVYDFFFPINGLMLSPVFTIAFFFLLFVLLKKTNIIDAEQFKTTAVFCLVIDILYFGVILWAYLFMLYPEISPESLAHMQNMTSHYSEGPLAANFMILLRLLLVDRPKQTVVSLAHFADISQKALAYIVILLLISIPTTFTLLFGEKVGIEGHEVDTQDRAAGEAQVSDLINKVENVDDPLNSRVLIADQVIGGTGYCYLHYGLSPISTVDIFETKDVRQLIDYAKQTHCNYVYFGAEYSDQIDELKAILGDDINLEELYKME